MKTSSIILTACNTMILLASCFVLLSCKEGEEAAPDETVSLLVSGPWHIDNITVDGVTKNDLFTDFALTFSTTTYTAVNGDPVWPASGTWTLTNAASKIITRDDGMEVIITSITATNLTLELHWDHTTLGGRTNSISGEYVFEFGR